MGTLQGLKVLGDLKSDFSGWLKGHVAPEEAGPDRRPLPGQRAALRPGPERAPDRSAAAGSQACPALSANTEHFSNWKLFSCSDFSMFLI